MSMSSTDRPFFRMILIWAAIVVVVAGMRASASLVVPFLLSLFLAILSGPPLEWLMKRGFRRSVAMLIVLGGLCIVVLGLARVVVATANDFIVRWPETYQPKAEALADDVQKWLREQAESNRLFKALNLDETSDDNSDENSVEPSVEPQDESIEMAPLTPESIDTVVPSTTPAELPEPADLASIPEFSTRRQWSEWIAPDVLMRTFTTGMRAATGILSQTLLILVTTIFLLMEASTLPAKMQAISGDAPSRIDRLQRIAEEVNSYMAIKTSTSLLTGGIVAVALWQLDVEFYLLWGVTAFLLNYIPNIGSIIAAVPAVLLTLLQHGLATAGIVVGLYVAVNMFIGYFLEPRWMGRGLGLSTLIVFVSLVFWGWVLGPVGMVISVPLTMAVKIALEGSDETRWLAILMGPGATQAISSQSAD